MIYQFLPEGQPVIIRSDLAPYKSVVVIERPVDADFRWEVSRQLVASGCRYMMAWGLDCSLWDDSVDWADLERFDYGDIPPDQFVMTTWHENDTLGEVFAFANRDALLSYDDVELHRCLVLDIAVAPREAEIQKIYNSAGSA